MVQVIVIVVIAIIIVVVVIGVIDVVVVDVIFRMKNDPLPVTRSIEFEFAIMVMAKLRSMRDGEDGNAELFASFIQLPFNIGAHRAGALVLFLSLIKLLIS